VAGQKAICAKYVQFRAAFSANLKKKHQASEAQAEAGGKAN